MIGTVALCEAGDVWDAAGWQTKESGGALSGAKRYVEHGDDAKLIVVGTAGGGLALVEAVLLGLVEEAFPVVRLAPPLVAGFRLLAAFRAAALGFDAAVFDWVDLARAIYIHSRSRSPEKLSISWARALYQ